MAVLHLYMIFCHCGKINFFLRIFTNIILFRKTRDTWRREQNILRNRGHWFSKIYKIGTIRKKRGQLGSQIIKVNFFFPRSLFLELHTFYSYVYYFKKLLIVKTMFVTMVQQPLGGQGPPHYRAFTITLGHPTIGTTPLDEWSVRLRDLYLTTHNTRDRHHTPRGIRSRYPSKRTAADPHFRPRNNWDWLWEYVASEI